MHIYIYQIRCSDIALVKLILLSVRMHCGTSFTRTHAILSQKSLTRKDVESTYICSISDLGNLKNKLANVILENDIV